MIEHPFQTVVIGKETIPARKGKYRKWGFISEMAKTIEEGQAIRLVLPRKQSISALLRAWHKMFHGNSHSRIVTQSNDTKAIYLWYGKELTK